MNPVQPTPSAYHRYRIPGPRRGDALSAREVEVMRLICEGKGYKEIGAALCVSKKTIEKHAVAIHTKWGVHNHVEVLRYAVLNGHYELRRWEGNPT